MREIANHFHYRSTTAARSLLAGLEARGHIRRSAGKDRAIEVLRPVRPSIGAADDRAVRMHALVQELRRRQRLSGHERLVEAIARRRLAAEAKHGEEIERKPKSDRAGPKV